MAEELTIPQVARLFQVTRRTVQRWLVDELLPGAHRDPLRGWLIPKATIEGIMNHELRPECPQTSADVRACGLDVIDPPVRNTTIASGSVARECEVCGRPLERVMKGGRLETDKEFARRHWCSRTCLRLTLQQPRNQNPLLAVYSAQALRFKKKACEACGAREKLEVHHVGGNWRDNREENLQTLCHACHRLWHNRAMRVGLRAIGRMPRRTQDA